LGESETDSVDAILARKTVRGTLALSDDPFAFLRALLDEKRLSAGGVDVEKGDYDYADDIVSCAGVAYTCGNLSLASLTAVYHLHASRIDPTEILPPAVAHAVLAQPEAPAMIPGLPNMMPPGADGIGVAQTRRVIAFLLRAWREQWPIKAGDQAPPEGMSIRSCVVADGLFQVFRQCRLTKPCMFRWYEC
jgi:hypothetical protein